MSTRNSQPVIDLLRTVPALSTLSHRTLARIVPFVDEAEAAAGAVIVREGVCGLTGSAQHLEQFL
jgi:hypothetical protein